MIIEATPILLIIECRMIYKFELVVQSFETNVSLVSILISTPNHTLLTYRCLI